MTKKLSTNDIFAKIEKGEPVDVKEVEFVSPDTMREIGRASCRERV